MAEPWLLSQRTTLGVGGAPRAVHPVRAEAELGELAAACSPDEFRVLGGGSNLVVADEGVPHRVLDLQLRGVEFRAASGSLVEVVAAAGESWDALVRLSCERGLMGLENLSGIPGRVGGAPLQNVGAYGREVADHLAWVEAFDLVEQRLVRLTASECELGYRTSRFKHREAGRWVVLRVAFLLDAEGAPDLRYAELARAVTALSTTDAATSSTMSSAAESVGVTTTGAQRWATPSQIREVVLELRRGKSMLGPELLGEGDENRRSCGSFFTNPVVSAEAALELTEVAARRGLSPVSFPDGNHRVKLAAGWLIEQAGLPRGTREGRVGLSSRHALALVAHAGATAADVVRFAWRVRRQVEDAWGVTLVPEPVFWGFSELDQGLPVLA
ncbi:MAG: UDP-N-acetylmuramate dehydrogenase [Polyangiaceae bacterium]|nr:UDP-N-acetylmuramate dehydrogenase [Polyangiaceae bacterium]MCW5791816.1 UDP-N-acetylmuramate dehydrogenase [Polyangiaceae bacterium]